MILASRPLRCATSGLATTASSRCDHFAETVERPSAISICSRACEADSSVTVLDGSSPSVSPVSTSACWSRTSSIVDSTVCSAAVLLDRSGSVMVVVNARSTLTTAPMSSE